MIGCYAGLHLVFHCATLRSMQKHIFVSYREKNQLTQAELAEKLGISRGMVSLIESGDRSITAENANAWAPVLGLDRGDLNPLFSASASA